MEKLIHTVNILFELSLLLLLLTSMELWEPVPTYTPFSSRLEAWAATFDLSHDTAFSLLNLYTVMSSDMTECVRVSVCMRVRERGGRVEWEGRLTTLNVNTEAMLTFQVTHMLPLIPLHTVTENMTAVADRVLQDGL